MARITEEDIIKLAKLSKLTFSDAQLHRFQSELQSIVGYVEQLSSVDVTGLEPTNQVTGLVNVMRGDEEKAVLSQAELLKNVPSTENNFIKVRRVLE